MVRERRLMDTERCAKFYENCLDLIEYRGRKYPSVPLYHPANLITLDMIEAETVSEGYVFPYEIYGLYEPVYHVIKDLFLEKGYFNSMKARLVNICDGGPNGEFYIRLQKTFYFYTWATNFLADYPIFKNKTLRDIYHDIFIKNIKRLEEDILSSHLGYGGLMVTRDGKIPLFLRNDRVAVNRGALAGSFGGSVDWHGRESLQKSLIQEIREEVGIEIQPQQIVFTGLERNMQFLGKPDMHFVVLADVESRKLRHKIGLSKTGEENADCIFLDSCISQIKTGKM